MLFEMTFRLNIRLYLNDFTLLCLKEIKTAMLRFAQTTAEERVVKIKKQQNTESEQECSKNVKA